MTLNDELQAIRAMSKASLDPADWAGLAATIERLRMLQIAEHSLALGEALPDFALPDAAGRVVTSDELLDRGPLVPASFRGGWCPCCGAALRALERARPALEDLGAALVGVAPCTPGELARIAAEEGLSFPLLSDTGGALSGFCGLLYAMTSAQLAFYGGRRGVDVTALDAGAGRAVPSRHPRGRPRRHRRFPLTCATASVTAGAALAQGAMTPKSAVHDAMAGDSTHSDAMHSGTHGNVMTGDAMKDETGADTHTATQGDAMVPKAK